MDTFEKITIQDKTFSKTRREHKEADRRDVEEIVFEDYLRSLKLSPDDLNKKRILDVGAGSADFARACRNHNIDAEVISLDPFHLERISKPAGEAEKRFIKGAGEMLPFKSESFDLVISIFAIPILLASAKKGGSTIEVAIREMLRVLRPGGEARFSPANLYKFHPKAELKPSDSNYNQIIEEILKKLESEGLTVKLLPSKEYRNARPKDQVGIMMAIIKKTETKRSD